MAAENEMDKLQLQVVKLNDELAQILAEVGFTTQAAGNQAGLS
jgi:hypothetical protein